MSSLLHDKLTTETIQSDNVTTSKINIDGNSVTSIVTSDQDKDVVGGVVESGLFFRTKQKTKLLLNDIKSKVDVFTFSPVISDSVLPAVLDYDVWAVEDISIAIGKAKFLQTTKDLIGIMRSDSSSFKLNGKYLLVIDVAHLPSGKIVVKDNTGTVIKTLTTTGTFEQIVEVTDKYTFNLIVEVSDMTISHEAIINSVGMCYIRPILDSYINTKLLDKIKLANLITENKLLIILKEWKENITDAYTGKLEAVYGRLIDHISAKNDPHGLLPTGTLFSTIAPIEHDYIKPCYSEKLAIDNYPKLKAYLDEHPELVVTKQEYETLLATGVDVKKFYYDETGKIITLPYIKELTYIKV